MTGEKKQRRGDGAAQAIQQIARIRIADRMAKTDGERKLSEGDIKQTSKFKSGIKEKDRGGGAG